MQTITIVWTGEGYEITIIDRGGRDSTKVEMGPQDNILSILNVAFVQSPEFFTTAGM